MDDKFDRCCWVSIESSPNPLHYALFNYSAFGRGTALLKLVVKIIILSQVVFSS